MQSIRMIGAVFVLMLLGTAVAGASSDNRSTTRKAITITGDSGGMVATYAMRVRRIKRENAYLRFDGRCHSACTLYLGLASHQTCVSPRSSFGFHLPYGVRRQQAAVARDYMLDQYPGWVKRWISANGGLTSQLKIMPYSYARRFMTNCGSKALTKAL